jgi:hypothetical protein
MQADRRLSVRRDSWKDEIAEATQTWLQEDEQKEKRKRKR